VLKLAHQVWTDREIARAVASDTSLIIKKCYETDPTFLCGKSSRVVLGGLFYLLGVRYKSPVTYRILAERLGATEFTLRNMAKTIAKVGGFGEYRSAKPHSSRDYYVCPFCSEKFNLLIAIQEHLQDHHDVASTASLRIPDFDEQGILKGAKIESLPKQHTLFVRRYWGAPYRYKGYRYTVVK